MNKGLKMIAWIVSILIIIFGLAYMSQSIIAGIMSILGGLLIMPPIYKMLKNKGSMYSKKVAIIMCAWLCIVSTCVFGVTANAKNEAVQTSSNNVAATNTSTESNDENNIINNETESISESNTNNIIENSVKTNNIEEPNTVEENTTVTNETESKPIEPEQSTNTTQNVTTDTTATTTKSKSSSSTPKASNKKATTSTSSSTSNSETVYITNTGSKYHRAGCRYLKSSSHAISKSSALSSGYSACSVCNP